MKGMLSMLLLIIVAQQPIPNVKDKFLFQAPVCLIELLKQGTEEELMLRWTTLLANILTKAKEQKLTSASLPADDKAPSPETMYTALYGVSSGQLKSKVYLLSRHKNENISHQASKIYQVITK